MTKLNRREVLAAGAAGGLALAAGDVFAGTAAARGRSRVDYRFPKGFLWGAGTAAIQQEGSPLADGAGQPIFHRWSQVPGNVPPGEGVDVTADFYNRYRSDVRLMRKLGHQAHQFSIGWWRVKPQGTGRTNRRGLDFYDRLVDELLDKGIAPVASLNVWDHPVAVEDNGSWGNRDTAEWFGEYAEAVFDRLGDRVTHWLTQCEALIFMHYSHIAPYFPPQQSELTGGLRALHHLNLAHGLAVQAFRASCSKGKIGNQMALAYISAKTDKPDDVAAAERVQAYYNRTTLDPFCKGEYPEILLDWWGDQWPADAVKPGDLETISTRMDFIGFDYYYYPSTYIAGEPDPNDVTQALAGAKLGATLVPVSGSWETEPEYDTELLRNGLHWLRDNYGDIPVYMIEIGHAVPDQLVGRRVKDPLRIAFIRDHLIAAHQAIREGVTLRGAFVWGLLDGWEFDQGFQLRYGLVHVDYNTQKRTVKDSGYWYRDVIAANGFNKEKRR